MEEHRSFMNILPYECRIYKINKSLKQIEFTLILNIDYYKVFIYYLYTTAITTTTTTTATTTNNNAL